MSLSRIRASLSRGFVLTWSVLALIFIFAVDGASKAVAGSTAEVSVFDEPVHLATALFLLLMLALLRREISTPFIIAALVASVVIDLDHIPQHLGWNGLTEGTPRPYTHSLVLPVLLLVIALKSKENVRQLALGAAFGLAAHLFRDLATGSGIALFWPVSSDGVGFSYEVYAVGLVCIAAAAAILSLNCPDSPSLRADRSAEIG